MKKYGIILAVLLMLCFCVSGISAEKNVYGTSKIRLTKTSLKLTVGSSKQLKVKGTTKTVKWSSSDKSIATVSKTGKVKAKKKGSTVIKAKVGEKTLKCKVKVKKASKTNYKKVYKAFLKKYMKSSDYSSSDRFGFVYLNNDKTPELVICSGTHHTARSNLYCIYNGKVKLLGDYL